MEKKMKLPNDSKSKLRCDYCAGYLSVPPITINKGKYSCGRCKNLGSRLDVYEELAKYVIFPCIHKDCNVELSWGTVLNHELMCPHKTMLCPFVNCKEVYKVKDILKHFQTLHDGHLFVENCICVSRKFRDLPFGQFIIDRRVYLFSTSNLHCIVMVYIDADKHKKNAISSYNFSFGVFFVKNKHKSISYEVDIVIKWESGIITHYDLTQQPILEFDDKIHCLKCIQGVCTVATHTNHKVNFLPTKLEKVQNRGDMMVTFIIKVVDTSISPPIVTRFNNYNKNSVSPLNCTACEDYMCAPIFLCESTHSFCVQCTRRLSKCVICNRSITKSRNAYLEEVAEVAEIPCHNCENGCTYAGPIRSTKQHQLACKYNFS